MLAFMRLRALASLAVVAVALTGCGGGGSSNDSSSPPPVPNNWDQMSWDQGKWQ
jgi:hypothetical protein